LTKKINIAIDGYSSCGKGTLAKVLAKSLNYIFIDTGAMYRAVTFALIRKGIGLDNLIELEKLLPSLSITFKHIPEDDFYHTFLNGEDIENEIRNMEVSNMVSPVSKIQIVRDFLVKQQQEIGLHKGVVMDGRDIGTVVFPNAELKIFMTAKAEIRAHRRLKELRANGNLVISYEEVLKNLNDRDYSDSNRANSPLLKAEDALVIDNSELSKAEQNELALEMAYKAISIQ
jgi:cytidylate kinase